MMRTSMSFDTSAPNLALNRTGPETASFVVSVGAGRRLRWLLGLLR